MKIQSVAFLAFPRLTTLDLIGAYDVLRRVGSMGVDPQFLHRMIGTAPEITDDAGFTFKVDAVFEDLSGYDLLVVPGGYGTRALMEDTRFLDYLRTWRKDRPVASVCSGALLLGAAGFLTGKRATTHRAAMDELRPYCREVVRDERIVDEGLVVTSGGVSAGIDLGLYLVERFWGRTARERIASQMEYRGLYGTR